MHTPTGLRPPKKRRGRIRWRGAAEVTGYGSTRRRLSRSQLRDLRLLSDELSLSLPRITRLATEQGDDAPPSSSTL